MDNKIKVLPKDFEVKRKEIAKDLRELRARRRHRRLAKLKFDIELKRINDDYEPI